jgi:hypothetical protein
MKDDSRTERISHLELDRNTYGLVMQFYNRLTPSGSSERVLVRRKLVSDVFTDQVGGDRHSTLTIKERVGVIVPEMLDRCGANSKPQPKERPLSWTRKAK